MYVKKVEYYKDYKLKILFSDNKTKIVDIEPIILKSKRFFKPLLNVEFFKRVSLDHVENPLGIRWPNDADICPDVLYEMGVEVKKEVKSTHRKSTHPSSTPIGPKISIAAKSRSR